MLRVVWIAGVLVAGPALAQTDQMAMMRAAAANQVGVMEYCQGRGDVSADAVTAQRAALAHLPGGGAGAEAGPAEALGRQGTLAAPNGTQMTLDSVASAHGTTVAALCKQMGDSAVQSATAMQQSGAAGGAMGMPAMPNGMAMPTMPNGMAMPGAPVPH